MDLQLLERLETLLDWTPREGGVADIGCDHGLLAVALAARRPDQAIVAIDISPAAIEKARSLAALKGPFENLEMRAGDGFMCLEPGEVETAIIAGLSAQSIADILWRGFKSGIRPPMLLLQPMSRPECLRRFLFDNGYRIDKEALIKAPRRYFHLIHAIAGQEEPRTRTEFELGWALIEARDEELPAYIQSRIRWMERCAAALEGAQRERAASRREELIERIEAYREVLECLHVQQRN